MTGMRSLFVLAMLGAHGAAAADNEAPQVTPELRQRAEDLAGAASQRFTDIFAAASGRSVAQSAAPPEATEQASRGWHVRAACGIGSRARRQAYDDVVIAQLKNPDGWTVIVQRSGDAAPAPAPTRPPRRKSRRASCADGAASSR